MVLITKVKQAWKNLDESWRVAIIAFLIARIFYTLWSGIILTLQPIAVHYDTVAGKSIAIFLDLQTNHAYAYSREINGKLLTFRSASRNTVLDLQTNSLWDITNGTAAEGYFQGTTLPSSIVPSDLFPYFHVTPYPIAWLSIWQRFDTNWYISIAENGYGNIKEDIHFPPFYPLLIRFAKPIFGNAFITALIISNLATLYALKLLVDIFNQWRTDTSTNNALLYFLLYPASFFLFSAYTESLFLVMTLLALGAMKRQSWAWAGFWTFCAILTRLQGVALFVPMVYLNWKDTLGFRRLKCWSGITIAGIGPSFYIFLRSTQNSSNLVPFTEPDLYARLAPPWEVYLYAVRTIFSGHFTYIDFLNWFIVTLFIILTLFGWRKTPMEYNLYMFVSLLILLTRVVETQPLMSMSRYVLTLFPAFHTLGVLGEKPWSKRIIIYSSIALNLFLSAQFFGWGWVA